MIKTVTIGSTVSIQGFFVRALNNGMIRIRVGNQFYDGFPVKV